MSTKEWGVFLTSRQTQTECMGVIREYNKLLATLDLPDEIILGVILEIHYTYDNVRGRNWYYGIYLRLDDRATKALQMLQQSGSFHGMSLSTRL